MFKEFTPLKEIMEMDWGVISTFIIGMTLMGLFFFALGIIFLAYSKLAEHKIISQMIGICFLCIFVMKVLFVMAVWHNYLILIGAFASFTGMSTMATLILVVKVIQKLDRLRDMRHLQKRINDLQERQETLKNLKTNRPDASDELV